MPSTRRRGPSSQGSLESAGGPPAKRAHAVQTFFSQFPQPKPLSVDSSTSVGPTGELPSNFSQDAQPREDVPNDYSFLEQNGNDGDILSDVPAGQASPASPAAASPGEPAAAGLLGPEAPAPAPAPAAASAPLPSPPPPAPSADQSGSDATLPPPGLPPALATYCRRLSNGSNFEPLSEANLAKMEESFRQKSDALAREVANLSKVLISPFDNKKLAAFESAMSTGHVDPRSHMGGVFRAAMKNDEKLAKEYSGLKRAEAAEFRLEWLKKEYKTFKEEKIYAKSWRRIDTTKGDYMSASQLVMDDGGWQDPEAVKGATILIEKALAMGQPWVTKHPQTGRTLFLKLKFSFKEEFEERWDMFRHELLDGNLDTKAIADAGGAAAGGAGAGGSPYEVKGEMGQEKNKEHKVKGKYNQEKDKVGQEKGEHGQDGDKGDKDKDKGDKDTGKKDTDFEDLWKTGLVNRKFLLGTMAAASMVDNQIATVEAWSWAKNEQNQGALKEKSSAVHAVMTEFHKSFLAEEPSTIRKRHTKDLISVELKGLNNLKPVVAELDAFVKKLQKRHIS